MRLLQNPPSLARWLALPVAAVLLCSFSLRATPAAAPDSAHAPISIVIDGHKLFELGFSQLSAFDYTIVDAGTGATAEQIAAAQKRDQVPDWVHFYSGKPVVLTGYLMPLQVENGLSKKFIVMKDVNTCCYGAVPNMNDYVVVTMKGEGVKPVQDIPIALVGTFQVEQKYENGYVTSLFQMEGEKFLGPKK